MDLYALSISSILHVLNTKYGTKNQKVGWYAEKNTSTPPCRSCARVNSLPQKTLVDFKTDSERITADYMNISNHLEIKTKNTKK